LSEICIFPPQICRSAVLEDIYRRYEHLSEDEEEEYDPRDRHGVDRDEDYDAEVSFDKKTLCARDVYYFSIKYQHIASTTLD
jgi:hypothetical protein